MIIPPNLAGNDTGHSEDDGYELYFKNGAT